MPSKKCRLPTQFGHFSKLPPERIEDLRRSAQAAVRAWKRGDRKTWEAVIDAANGTLTKHETGVFSAFAMAEIPNG